MTTSHRSDCAAIVSGVMRSPDEPSGAPPSGLNTTTTCPSRSRARANSMNRMPIPAGLPWPSGSGQIRRHLLMASSEPLDHGVQLPASRLVDGVEDRLNAVQLRIELMHMS